MADPDFIPASQALAQSTRTRTASGGFLSRLPEDIIEGINNLGGGVAKGISLGYAQPPFYDPASSMAKIGNLLGSVAPYATGEGLGGELAIQGAKMVPSGLGGLAKAAPLLGTMAGSGATAALGKDSTGLDVAAATLLPGLGAPLTKAGEALTKLKPIDQFSAILSHLGAPIAENHPKLALGDLQGEAKNGTAASNMLRHAFGTQKKIARGIYTNDVVMPAYQSGIGDNVPLPSLKPGLEQLKSATFVHTPDRLEDYLKNPNIEHALSLKVGLNKDGALLRSTDDTLKQAQGAKIHSLAGKVVDDIVTHLNSGGQNLGDNLKNADAYYRFHIIPYYHLPGDYLHGTKTNIAGFSRHFLNPDYGLTDAPGDKTSLLNIFNHQGNDELARRVILDRIKDAGGKLEFQSSPKTFVRKLLGEPGLEPYLNMVPAVKDALVRLRSELKPRSRLGEQIAKGSLLGTTGYLLHGHVPDLALGAAAAAAYHPAVSEGIEKAIRTGGKGLLRTGQTLSKPTSKALLGAAGGNL